MSAIKVKTDHFVGNSKLYTIGSDGLANVIRSMLIDNARLKVEVSGVADFVDSSTGTAGSQVAIPLPAAAIDATSAGGAQLTALNATLVKIANAGAVIVGTLNTARALLGLTAYTSPGTIATAGTIPAQDKASTAASGTAAVSFASAVASLGVAANNLANLYYGVNEVLTALGVAPLGHAFGATVFSPALTAIPVTVAVAAGPGAAAKADVDAALLALANDVATLAAAWNGAMNQGSPGAGPLHVVAG